MPKTIQIELTNGMTTIIDASDEKKVRAVGRWYVDRKRNGRFYATNHTSAKSPVYLHRVLVSAGKKEQVDHINGNGLDNRRMNLRVCSPSENQCNRGKEKSNTSGFKGVGFDKRNNKWYARVGFSKNKKWLGYFTSKTKAARAYDKVARQLHGEFAFLNFTK